MARDLNRAKAFGSRIRQLREGLKLTQVQVAASVPIDDSTLSRYEKGELDPPADDVIARLAVTLGVEKSELLGLAGRGVDPTAFEALVLEKLDQIIERLDTAFPRPPTTTDGGEFGGEPT